MTAPQTSVGFRCPECGSPHFTTVPYSAASLADATGVCQGRQCGFTWPRILDWKYWVAETTRNFESQDEYDACVDVSAGKEEWVLP